MMATLSYASLHNFNLITSSYRKIDHLSAEAQDYKILLQKLRSKVSTEDAQEISHLLLKVRDGSISDYPD